MIENKKVVLINGSPKPMNQPSLSDRLVTMEEASMKASGIEVYKINVRESLNKEKTKEDYEAMLQADAIIITFPLYIFCLPGVLMRFLQDFQQVWSQKGFDHKVKIYTVVNCGFPEAYINEEAVRVIQSFSRQLEANFRFGIQIGGGGMLISTLDAPFMKNTKTGLEQAFRQIAEDIHKEDLEPLENISLELKFPHKLYHVMGNRGWFSAAKQNGLKKKDLYRRLS